MFVVDTKKVVNISMMTSDVERSSMHREPGLIGLPIHFCFEYPCMFKTDLKLNNLYSRTEKFIAKQLSQQHESFLQSANSHFKNNVSEDKNDKGFMDFTISVPRYQDSDSLEKSLHARGRAERQH